MLLKTFEFLSDRFPFGYAYNFDNYLFNKIKHIQTQGIDDRADYFIVNNVKKRIEGKIHFLLKDGIAYSPFKSLFGSFEFNHSIHPNLLQDFWSFIEYDLSERKIGRVKITSFADCYAPNKAALILRTMKNSGFNVVLKAVNHHIDVTNDSLQSRMHAMEVRRLKKCKRMGFSFQQEASEKAKEVYDFLSACRKEQQLTLSIPGDKFLDYLDEFPQYYPFFTVRNGDEILAATITIQVHRKILYSFLPGSLRKFKNYSPTVMLNDGLYNYCQEHQIDMLDLGISTEKDGKDQITLISFKERIGGEKSYKYFFEKVL